MSQMLRWSVRRAQLQLDGLEKASIDLILEEEQVAEYRSQQKPNAAADPERVTAYLSPKRKPIVELPDAEIPILQVDVGKKHELNTLERICKHAGGVVAAFRHEYEFRDGADGLWLIERNANHNDSPDDNEFSNWHPHRDHDRPALPLPFTVFDLAAFLMLGPGLVFMFEQYGVDVAGDQPSELSVKRLGGNAGAEVALLRAVCRLIDEARFKFDWHDKLPSAAVATDSAKWLLSMNQTEVAMTAATVSSPVPQSAALTKAAALPYLSNWATAQEAVDWLAKVTREEWPLVRLYDLQPDMALWLKPPPDVTPEVLSGGFLGREEGFMAPVVFAPDFAFLAFERSELTLSMTRRPDCPSVSGAATGGAAKRWLPCRWPRCAVAAAGHRHAVQRHQQRPLDRLREVPAAPGVVVE
jgi:hypothetical protein